LGPQDEVLTEAAVLLVVLAFVAAFVLLLLLLLPHPASTITLSAATSARTTLGRTRGASWTFFTDLSSS
jgi:hypothetical protein